MDATPSQREQYAVPNRPDDPKEQEHEYKPDRQCRPPHRWKGGYSKSRLNCSGHLSRQPYGPEDRQKRSHHQSYGCTRKSKRLHNESPKGNYVGYRYSRRNFELRQPIAPRDGQTRFHGYQPLEVKPDQCLQSAASILRINLAEGA